MVIQTAIIGIRTKLRIKALGNLRAWVHEQNGKWKKNIVGLEILPPGRLEDKCEILEAIKDPLDPDRNQDSKTV